jgi:hypothetical protein
LGLLFGFVLLLLPLSPLLAFAFGGLHDNLFDVGGARSLMSNDSDGIHVSPNDSYSVNGDGVFLENQDCIFTLTTIHNNGIARDNRSKVWVIFKKAIEAASIMATTKTPNQE